MTPTVMTPTAITPAAITPPTTPENVSYEEILYPCACCAPSNMNYFFDIETLIPASRQRPDAIEEDDRPEENQTRPGNHAGTRDDFRAMTSEFMDYCNDKPAARIGLFSYEKYAKVCFILSHPKLKALRPAKGASQEEFAQYSYLRVHTQENYFISENKLFRKMKRGRKNLQVATFANALGFIVTIHEDLSGAKARSAYTVIKDKYFGITRDDVEWFMRRCNLCVQRLPNMLPPPPQVIKSTAPLERVQIDLIDFTSLASGGFKWILHIKDHFTKVSLLYPLKSKHASAIAHYLDEFVRYYGAPEILQCNNCLEFKGAVLLLLKKRNIKLINGRPRHPRSQGLVERGNQTVKRRLTSWMTLRATADWPEALETVERSINMTCCKGLPSGMTPHEALFTYGRIRRHESLIRAELVREDITHRALGMTPEEIDDACFQQEISGNNAAFRAIDEFYNRLPTTEEAILDYEIGEESFPLLTESDAPVGRSDMPVLENGQPRAESVPQNVESLAQDIEIDALAVREISSGNDLQSAEEQHRQRLEECVAVGSENSAVSNISHSSLPVDAVSRAFTEEPYPHNIMHPEPQISCAQSQLPLESIFPANAPNSNYTPQAWPLLQIHTSHDLFPLQSMPPISNSPSVPFPPQNSFPFPHITPPQVSFSPQISFPTQMSLHPQNPFLPRYSIPTTPSPTAGSPIYASVLSVHVPLSETTSANLLLEPGHDHVMTEKEDDLRVTSEFPSANALSDSVRDELRSDKFRRILEAQAKGKATYERVFLHKEKEATQRVLKYSHSKDLKNFKKGDIATYLIPKEARGPLEPGRV